MMIFPFWTETSACSQLMETMTSRFLTLLGWKHAMKGDKGIPFQQSSTMLGEFWCPTSRGDWRERNVWFNRRRGDFHLCAGDCWVAPVCCWKFFGGYITDGVQVVFCNGCWALPDQLQKVRLRAIDLTLPSSPLLVFIDASWEPLTSMGGCPH